MATSKAVIRKRSRGSDGPRSLALAGKGISTGVEFCELMSALMSDVIEGSLSPGVANAAVNAGGKLLKAVELQIKFGAPGKDGRRVLNLVGNGQLIEGESK
jgi:hypothetical protein